jgi:hypothetical protein
MNWKQINRDKRVQHEGVYTAWKQQISDECFNQCVYCSIQEGPWGGIDHYHIDHFRPQSKFKKLKNKITNLYYACPICNKFKSDDWQGEPDDLNVICYPDPSDHNYTDLFTVDTNNYALKGNYVSANYLINRMYLNRPQLIYERREFFLTLKAKAIIKEAQTLIDSCDDIDLVKQAARLEGALVQHLLKRGTIPPYKLVEIQKPKKKKRGK